VENDTFLLFSCRHMYEKDAPVMHEKWQKKQGILKYFASLLAEVHFNNGVMQSFPSRCKCQATKKVAKLILRYLCDVET
jgi:hypothetical protein